MTLRFSSESQSVLIAAQREARGSGLFWPAPEHLLVALLEDRSVGDALRALGVDPSRVAQQARDHLASLRPAHHGHAGAWSQRAWSWLFPPVPRDVARIQRRAAVQVRVSGRTDITPLDLFVALLRHSDLRGVAPRPIDVSDDPYRRAHAAVAHPLTVLRQAGVSTVALLRFVAHGDSPRAPEPAAPFAPDARVEVHFINDDYTTMAFVVAVLREEFGLGPQAAADLAERVHWEGVGVVGTLRYAEAERALRRIEERAARGGFPLKVVVTAAGEVATGDG